MNRKCRTSRRAVLEKLTNGEATANELAISADVTSTAIRMALTWLFAAELVKRRTGERPGIKRASLYAITPKGRAALADPAWTGFPERRLKKRDKPDIAAIRARYREQHAKHVERQRMAGIPDKLIFEGDEDAA